MSGSPFQARLELVRITFAQAAEGNAEHHRDHPDATGHKFSIGVATIPDGELVGVAICGRPVARALDNGRTIEVSHVYEAVEAPFDARDPKWKRCLEGCRPAAGMHRTDCPNRRELQVLRAMAGMVAGRLARMAP